MQFAMFSVTSWGLSALLSHSAYPVRSCKILCKIPKDRWALDGKNPELATCLLFKAQRLFGDLLM